MKCALIYFSGTGITPRYATEISKGIQSAAKNTEINFIYIRLKENIKIDLKNFDLIGLGAPAYSLRAPRLALKLMRKIDLLKKPFFVFCTYNSMAGNTLWDIFSSVKKTAGTCLGYKKGSIAVNIRAWLPNKSSKEALKKISSNTIDEAQNFGQKIFARYQQIKSQQSKIQKANWIPPKKLVLFIWGLFLTWNWQMMATVGFKRVDKSKCIRCGLCAETICPSKAITLDRENYPKIDECKCVGCNGCVNLCPTEAIWSRKSKNNKKYDLYKKFIFDDKYHQ